MAKLIDIVITTDLEDVIAKSYQDVPLNLRVILDKITSQFISLLSGDILKDFRLHICRADFLSRELRRMKMSYKDPFISLDEIHISWADYYLLITNVFEPPNSTKWTNKPGSCELTDQIQAVRNHGAVLLGDIGAQTGQTAAEVIHRLAQVDIKVSRILLGVASNMATKRLSQFAPVQIVFPFERAYWVELKDMLGLDGRLIRDADGSIVKIPTWEEFIQIGPFTEKQKLQLRDVCQVYSNLALAALQSAGLCPTRLPIHKQAGCCYVEGLSPS